MIDAIIVFVTGLVVGNFINIVGVLKNQSFHSKRLDEVENKIDKLLNK